MSTGILELAIVILAAAGLGIVAKIFKQPTVLAYILAGVVVGWFGFFHLGDKEIFRLFSDLGIMFLLFLVGMEINFTSLRFVGKTSLTIGMGQIIFSFIVGFLLALAFKFNTISAAYIAIALTFSSTIIVIKLLSEKKDSQSLYGKIATGVLLVQDFMAVLILVLLTGVGGGKEIIFKDIFLTVIKGAVLFALMLWLGRKYLPLIFDKIARSSELLFMASLSWLFLVAAIISLPQIGFPVEIGGLLAGLALANSSEHFQISSRIKSLRDFFILIFFVILGSSIIFSNFSNLALPIIVFSLFVLIGNPLIVLVIMGLLGYRKRTSFMTGVTIAQISEFSLILAALGSKLGHISNGVVSLITAVGIITITLSTYLIIFANKIFRMIEPYLAIFERKTSKEINMAETEFNKPIIIIGCHRVGQSITHNLPKKDILIIDFDPDIVSRMRKHGYTCLFGDISDDEIFEKANFEKAKLVISTSPDFEDSMTLLERINLIKSKNPKIKIILRAEDESEAKILYKMGVDYVLLPHLTSGQYLGKTIAVDPEAGILEQLKKRDVELMDNINNHLIS